MDPWLINLIAAATAAKAQRRRDGKGPCWQWHADGAPEEIPPAGDRPREGEPFPAAPPPAAAPGDWQFKVVRGWFPDRGAMEALQEEQAAFGWRLVEVLDERHVRFGRPAAVAAKDVARDGNPYSTTSRIGGRSAGRAVAVLAGLALAVALGLTLLTVRMSDSRPAEPVTYPTKVIEPAPPVPPLPTEAVKRLVAPVAVPPPALPTPPSAP